jgi:formamidopyrimidine-DNA glycosylase
MPIGEKVKLYKYKQAWYNMPMPELPEVETIANGLRGPLIGRTFTGVLVGWENIVARPAVPEFQQRIRGRQILDIRRRGKYLIFDLSGGGSLLIHLKMTGQLVVRPGDVPPDKYGHTVFDLDDGRQLRFLDMRKFGRVYLVADEKEVVEDLGPEPLADDFTLSEFSALIGKRRGALKPLLLNQQFIAGIGNIYADEALFAAGIHPQRKADTLTDDEIERLYQAIRQVLRQALADQGTTFDGVYRKVDGGEGEHQENLRVFRRKGQPCPRCGRAIERIVVGGRGTHLCLRCQK